MTKENRENLAQTLTERFEEYEFPLKKEANVVKEPQYFVYPSSPHKKGLSLFKRALTYTFPFTPRSPLLTSRSLLHNISKTKTHSSIFPNSLTDDEINNLMTDESRLMNMWSAGFTIVNVYMGLSLLSYPYAVSQGGIISFIILAFMSVFMSWTGKLLVRCFIRMPPSKRTYPDVAYASFGKYGSAVISFGIIFEFVGATCTNFIFLWNNTRYFIDSLQSEHINIGNGNNILMIALISCAVLLPTIWILNLDKLSFIAFLGCLCKVLSVVSILVCFIFNLHSVKDNISDHEISMYPKDANSLSICLGIFFFSFAGHPVLPSVYNSMKEPERFESLLDRCFLCLFVIYFVMGLFGYLQFADGVDVIITENLIKMDNAKGIMQVLVVFIVCGLYFQIAPLLSLVAEIPEMIVFNIESSLMQRIFRTLLFVVCAVLSYIIMNNLAVLEAMIGSMCTMITSVVGPLLFYFAIYRNDNVHMRVVLFGALFGVVFGFFSLFNDLRSLIQ